MSSKKPSAWCVVKNCNKNNIMEKRHFFRFLKEHDRWLQWIQGCDRLDLEAIGAEHAYRNYRVCHLHFEEKWYNINKNKPSLNPNAIPTIFFERNNVSITSEENNVENNQHSKDEKQTEEQDINIFQNDAVQDKAKSDLQLKASLSTKQPHQETQKRDRNVEIDKPNTSSSSRQAAREKESPRKKKLRQQIFQLKKRIKVLEERNRRLQKKCKRNLKNIEEKPKDHEILRQLT